MPRAQSSAESLIVSTFEVCQVHIILLKDLQADPLCFDTKSIAPCDFDTNGVVVIEEQPPDGHPSRGVLQAIDLGRPRNLDFASFSFCVVSLAF